MPLGLLHVGSALAGQPVEVVDGRFDLAPEARVAGLAREALLLGVAVRTGRPIADALEISRAVRAANPSLPIVWGGPHPTLFPEECLASGVVDACVRGMGEETLAELVAALRADGGFSGVPGLAWRHRDHVRREPARAPLGAARPARIDYGLLELEHYFRARGSRRLDYCSSRRPWPPPEAPAPEAPWSALGAERVVADLRDLVARLRLEEVAFLDEDFFAEPRRAEAIGRGLLEAGVHVAWSAAGRSATLARLGPEPLRVLAASGCFRVQVLTPGETDLAGEAREAILEAARRLQGAGIGARFSFMAGFPGREAGGLAEIRRLACALRRMDGRFETPIRLHAPYPGAGGADWPGFRVPRGLEEWAEAGIEGGGPWIPDRVRRRALRYDFFLGEAYRAPGRRWGKRLLRFVARTRVRLGFYALDLERHAVEVSARLRTGRRRGSAFADD